ncbi:MAG: DUF4131 domain-containing protein, partial [Luteimonas sp.]
MDRDAAFDAREAAAPFGLGAATALLAGCTACLFGPALPPVWLMAAGLPGSLLAWAFGRRLRLAGVFACGFALAGLHATAALALRLPPALEGADIVVAGTVVDLPQTEPGRLRFRFRVDDDCGSGAGARVG